MKQYNLLRPIALNELVVGMQILFVSNQRERHEQLETVVALPNEQNYFVTQSERGTFYIVPSACYYYNPLTWIEDKPVYKGDVLWYKYGMWSMEVTGYNHRTSPANIGLEGIVFKGDDVYNVKGNESWAPFENWTWVKTQVERSAWINIYKNGICGDRYPNRNTAFKERMLLDYIDTIQITWKE